MTHSDANLHSHVFLGEGHERNERRTWTVIALCSFMMIAEIIGGLLFGSIALIADGLHMSTHASALLLAALAYRFARRHVDDLVMLIRALHGCHLGLLPVAGSRCGSVESIAT